MKLENHALRKAISGFAAMFLCLCFAVVDAPAENKLIVSTKSGKVRGVVRPSGGAEFLGIPYAEAPVGNLRWHEPVPRPSVEGSARREHVWRSLRATAFSATGIDTMRRRARKIAFF